MIEDFSSIPPRDFEGQLDGEEELRGSLGDFDFMDEEELEEFGDLPAFPQEEAARALRES